jgi:hypothetical protein
MSKKANSRTGEWERRRFLLALPFLAAAPLLTFGQEGKKERKPLAEILTREEWERTRGSLMAAELETCYGNGYSCAESLWLAALRRMKKPEDLVWTATAFGGGMGQKDLCGFLTAGLMAIGMAAGQLGIERPEAKKRSAAEAKAYWQWFQALSPIRCADIRPPGSSGDICRRLGQLAAARIDRVIEQMKA